jgi:hypothetical protein
MSQVSKKSDESIKENENVGTKLSHNSVLKNIQCLEPLKISSNDELLTISTVDIRSESDFVKVERRNNEIVLSTPATGIDSTLNYDQGKLTVNLESIFARSALKATAFKVDLRRPKAPILVQGGALILDLDEFSAMNVVRTGLSLTLKPNGGLEQDNSGLRVLCKPPLVIENNVLQYSLSKYLLKNEGTFRSYGNLFVKEVFPYSRKDYGLIGTNSTTTSGVRCTANRIVKITLNVRNSGQITIATQMITPGLTTISRKILFKNMVTEYFSTAVLHEFSENETCAALYDENNVIIIIITLLQF